MSEYKYTSLELSKKLEKGGCELKSNKKWIGIELKDTDADGYRNNWADDIYQAYDILYDICIKYAKEFFGDSFFCDERLKKESIIYTIFTFLQNNRKQEAEEYIWDNCLFNKKNKVENV